MIERLCVLLLSTFLASQVWAQNNQQNYCQETNVAYEGQFQTTKQTKNPGECSQACGGNRRCSHWSWQPNGDCQILTASGQTLHKFGTRGVVSGTKPGPKTNTCNRNLVGIDCHYTDTRDPVICLFPFNGDSPGNRNTSSNQHNTCLVTKRGHYWCATKLTKEGLVIQASVQTRDITCGAALNPKGEHYCTAGQQNSGCVEGWGPWSSWSTCLQATCSNNKNGQQKRTRTCVGKNASKCEGQPTETKSCSSPSPDPACSKGTPAPSSSSSGGSANSCSGRCGQPAGLGQCQCSSECVSFGDCCKDFQTACPAINSQQQQSNSCSGKCGARFDRKLSCQCNTNCADHGNCCKDFNTVCAKPNPSSNSRPSSGGSSSSRPSYTGTLDADLKKLSERLLSIDENNVADKIELNTGCSTRVGNPRDCSSSNLFTRVDTSIFRKPVYQKLQALYENYDPDVRRTEDNLAEEKREEDALLNEVINTKVMKETLDFLKSKRLFTKSEAEFKKLLKELWFSVYSRGNRILGSSGFEHVFLGEKKDGKVQGFHNWVYFHFLEKTGKVNYLGQWRVVDLNGRGTGLAFTFTWGKEQKPFASMLVGTSPELELAVYTTCLLAKGEEPCTLSLGGKTVDITIHVFTRPRGVRYIASSYMDWK